MTLPTSLILSVNAILVVSGQPHFSDIPHTQLATECTVWELQSLSEPKGIDEKLAEVRRALVNESVVAYKSVDWWWGPMKRKPTRSS